MSLIKRWYLVASLSASVLLFLVGFSAMAAGQKLQVTDGFARYKFGSVEVMITAADPQVMPGTTLHLNAIVTNNNDYPIVDGSVYIKVFRKQKVPFQEGKDYFKVIPDKELMRNGDFLIDQFMALENISLKANEKKTIPFTWEVPKNLLADQYKVVSYFQSAKKFNLLGLTFSDDINGNFYSFSINNSPIEKIVEFDRNHVELNEKTHDFVSFISTYEETEDITIDAPLINNTDESQSVTVSWDEYYWDALLEQNKINIKNETLVLAPHETKVLRHVVPGNQYPVNYIVAKASWLDTYSILNIRFARNTHEKARTNFMGISSFPLQANQPAVVFTTAHSVKQTPFLINPTGNSQPEPGEQYTLRLTVKDKQDSVLETFSYNGEITGKVLGMESNFIPKEDYDYLLLETTIRNAKDEIVDKSSLVYDCQKIDPSTCKKLPPVVQHQPEKKITNVVIAIMIIVGLLSLLFIIRKKKKGDIPEALVVFLVFVLGWFIQTPGIHAASPDRQIVIPNFIGTRAYIQCWKGGCGSTYDGWTAIEDLSSSVTYDATSTANESNVLSVGDTFEIKDMTHSNPYAIYWFVQGYWYDSPYGCWNDSLSWSDDYIGSACEYEIFQLYDQAGKRLMGTMLVKPPTFSLTTDGPVSCNPKDDYSWSCTVTGGGNIGVSLKYSSTDGRFYYRSYGFAKKNNPDVVNGYARIDEFQNKLKCLGDLCHITTVYDGVCSTINYKEGYYSPLNTIATCNDPVITLPENNFTWNYSAAQPDATCQGTIPDDGTVTLCPNDTVGLVKGNTYNYHLAASCSASNVNTVDYCEYTCNSGYVPDLATGTCVPESNSYTLTVTKQGTGNGTVTGPGGINCGSGGAVCSANFLKDSVVNLSAIPNTEPDFGGWGGDCGSTGQCIMNSNKIVTATFNGTPPPPCQDTAGCGACSKNCGGGEQSCTNPDCTTYTQNCNTQACPRWQEIP